MVVSVGCCLHSLCIYLPVFYRMTPKELPLMDTRSWASWYVAYLYYMNTTGMRLFDEGKMLICNCGPSLTLPLSWTATLRIIKKEFTLIGTFFDILTKEKCWLSLWANADSQPVVGIAYSPLNIYYKHIFLFLYFDWSQRLMIW